MLPRALIATVLALAVLAPAAHARVLLFTKTTGFRHASIGPAVAALTARFPGARHTEDAGVFSAHGLRDVDAVVFLLTSGDVLDRRQRAALKRWVRAGSGWVGVHAAADTERDWPFYGTLLGGARFRSHPAPYVGTVRVDDPVNPSTRALPARWNCWPPGTGAGCTPTPWPCFASRKRRRMWPRRRSCAPSASSAPTGVAGSSAPGCSGSPGTSAATATDDPPAEMWP